MFEFVRLGFPVSHENIFMEVSLKRKALILSCIKKKRKKEALIVKSAKYKRTQKNVSCQVTVSKLMIPGFCKTPSSVVFAVCWC